LLRTTLFFWDYQIIFDNWFGRVIIM